MWTYNYIYPSELYHHGVKGQKWGVRRYQNPDGSLTSEGKKRYLKDYESIEIELSNTAYKNDMARQIKEGDKRWLDYHNKSYYMPKSKFKKYVFDNNYKNLDKTWEKIYSDPEVKKKFYELENLEIDLEKLYSDPKVTNAAYSKLAKTINLKRAEFGNYAGMKYGKEVADSIIKDNNLDMSPEHRKKTEEIGAGIVSAYLDEYITIKDFGGLPVGTNSHHYRKLLRTRPSMKKEDMTYRG